MKTSSLDRLAAAIVRIATCGKRELVRLPFHVLWPYMTIRTRRGRFL